MKKLLITLTIIGLSGCCESNRIKIGMKVTNGYCNGIVVSTNILNTVLTRLDCYRTDYKIYGTLDFPTEDLTEVK